MLWVYYDTVSGLNATDKTPMYEMPLVYGFGGRGFGVEHFLYWGFGQWRFVIGILSRDHYDTSINFTPNLGSMACLKHNFPSYIRAC